jgi:hypothetical protein
VVKVTLDSQQLGDLIGELVCEAVNRTTETMRDKIAKLQRKVRRLERDAKRAAGEGETQ